MSGPEAAAAEASTGRGSEPTSPPAPAGRERVYRDFVIQLHSFDRAADTFNVSVPPTDGGEAEVEVAYRVAELEPALQALESGSLSGGDLIDFGQALASRLLPPGDVLKLFEAALAKAGIDGGVRLRLVIHDLELTRIPWEYTYLQRHPGERDVRYFLLLDPRVSLVRHPAMVEQLPDVGITSGKLRFLAAMANIESPLYPQLELAKERAAITSSLDALKVDGATIEMEAILEQPTRQALFERLQGGADLFHFAGHGVFQPPDGDPASDQAASVGSIVVVSAKGNDVGELIGAGELRTHLLQAGVRLAVLGACDSGRRDGRSAWTSIAPALLEAGIAATVAMQYAIVDEDAIAFSRTFYRALASGMSIDEAVSLGRLAILGTTRGAAQWGIPVLYSRAPDGVLFPRSPDHPSATANELRAVVHQTVATIEAGGELIGIRSMRLGADGPTTLDVDQGMTTLRGRAIGIDAGDATAGVRTDASPPAGSTVPAPTPTIDRADRIDRADGIDRRTDAIDRRTDV